MLVNRRITDTSKLSQDTDDLSVIKRDADLCYSSEESVALQSEHERSFRNDIKIRKAANRAMCLAD